QIVRLPLLTPGACDPPAASPERSLDVARNRAAGARAGGARAGAGGGVASARWPHPRAVRVGPGIGDRPRKRGTDSPAPHSPARLIAPRQARPAPCCPPAEPPCVSDRRADGEGSGASRPLSVSAASACRRARATAPIRARRASRVLRAGRREGRLLVHERRSRLRSG